MNFGGKDGVSTDAGVTNDDGTASGISPHKTINESRSVRVNATHSRSVLPKHTLKSKANTKIGSHADTSHAAQPVLRHTQVRQTIKRSGYLLKGICSPGYDRICTRGHHVSIFSGEAVLEYADFRLPGAIPLTWSRHYRTNNDLDTGLGVGWSTRWFSCLQVNSKHIIYIDGEGRKIPFARIDIGDGCKNTIENLTLYCDSETQYRIEDASELIYIFTAYDNKWRLTSIENKAGNSISLEYNSVLRIKAIIDSVGRRIQLDYNVLNRVNSVYLVNDKGERSGHSLVQYRYGQDGELVAVIDAAGNEQQFTYQNSIIKKVTNKDGFSFYFEWDKSEVGGRCVRSWGDGAAHDCRFEYDAKEKITYYIDCNGNKTGYHYNSLGFITRKIEPEGGTKIFQYNKNGLLTKKIDAVGNEVRYDYDNRGLLIKVVDELGHVNLFNYDKQGRVITMIDAKGHRWPRRYDALGRLESVSDPEGGVTGFKYDNFGNIASIVDAENHCQRFKWNERGELMAVIDAAGCRKEFKYDELGRIIQIKDRRGNFSHYQYDVLGRLTQVKRPDGGCIRMHYTPEGNLYRFVDALGRVTQYRYDGLEQPVERIDPAGYRLKYTYDLNRNLTALVNENGDRYQFHYDKNLRLIKEVGFDGRVQQYSYNLVGHMECYYDGKVRITQYKRDALGRILKLWSSDGEVARFEYDALGRLTKAINPHSELQYEYSQNGYLLGEYQNGKRLVHSYNKVGKRVSTVLPNGETVSYEFNGQGLFNRVTYRDCVLTKITRNFSGLEVVRSSGETNSFYDYDVMGRLSYQKMTVGTNVELDCEYNYDIAGNLLQVDDFLNDSRVYYYDELDRLKKTEGQNPEIFNFDPAGNLISSQGKRSAGYIQGNRITNCLNSVFEYDDAGNIVAEKKNELLKRFYYNGQNQLVSVEQGNKKIQFKYDALGRRILKTDATGETSFLWDRELLIQEQKGDVKISYIYEPGGGKPIAQIRNNEIFYYHNNDSGTPVIMTNESGKIVWLVQYRTFGRVRTYHIKEIDNAIQNQGRYFDKETGMYCYRSRYFHSGFGRFINQDPNGFLGGHNAYTLTSNSPNLGATLGFETQTGIGFEIPAINSLVGSEIISSYDLVDINLKDVASAKKIMSQYLNCPAFDKKPTYKMDSQWKNSYKSSLVGKNLFLQLQFGPSTKS